MKFFEVFWFGNEIWLPIKNMNLSFLEQGVKPSLKNAEIFCIELSNFAFFSYPLKMSRR